MKQWNEWDWLSAFACLVLAWSLVEMHGQSKLVAHWHVHQEMGGIVYQDYDTTNKPAGMSNYGPWYYYLPLTNGSIQ